ncbi:unnamed protein product, partial [Timema podura]|nr:unnamed protein product [Timema podura]
MTYTTVDLGGLGPEEVSVAIDELLDAVIRLHIRCKMCSMLNEVALKLLQTLDSERDSLTGEEHRWPHWIVRHAKSSTKQECKPLRTPKIRYSLGESGQFQSQRSSVGKLKSRITSGTGDISHTVSGLGMKKVEISGSVPAFTKSGKPPKKNHSQDTRPGSNHYLPIIVSLVYWEISSLDQDHAAIKAPSLTELVEAIFEDPVLTTEEEVIQDFIHERTKIKKTLRKMAKHLYRAIICMPDHILDANKRKFIKRQFSLSSQR